MGLGIKRECGSCGAKFYDLEKDPIICPKCGTNYTEFMLKAKPKRNKKEIVDENDIEDLEDLDLDLGDVEELEEIDDEDAQIEDLDGGIRDSMEMEDDEEVVRDKAASDDTMLDLEGDSDDMIDSGREEDEEEDSRQ